MELVLTDEHLIMLGELAHAVQHAIKQWENDRSVAAFKNLGLRNVSEARNAISLTGRKGRCPWSSLYFRRNLPYIRSSSLVLLPPAHMLLHGIKKTFLKMSFGKGETGWKTRDASDDKPLLFSRDQINSFKVRTL
jgi:hypothetical protein